MGAVGEHAEALVGEDGVDAGLGEDEFGAFIRVIGVDGDVSGADGQSREDREVELFVPGGHPHAHAVAAAQAVGVQFLGPPVHCGHELGIGQDTVAVVDGGGVGVALGGGGQDVVQGARRRGLRTPEEE